MASRFPKPRSRYSLSEAIMGTNSTGITTYNGGGVVPYSTDTIRPHEERKSIQFTDFPTNYEEIVKFINGKHSPEDNTDFPVDDLFTITEIIIKHATDDSMVNDILKETNAPYEKVPSINDGFVSPLCILKSICCEISTCKDKACSGEEISIRTKREVIFDKLKPYPWEAKAVLALAAFALEYGDFWHLAQLYGQCNQLTNSVAILKRVPVLINQATLKERQGQVLELNGLIKDTLEVTRLICKVEGLYILNRTEDLPTLQTAVDDIPIYVFWIITAIVACAAKVTHLTSDEKKPYPLSDVVKEIGRIREILDELHGRCVEELEVAKNYKKLLRKMKDAQRTREITEVIKTLILFKDGKLPVISEGNSNEEVKFETFVDLVKENSVLFYISSLEKIIEADIADLIKVYDEIQKTNIRWRIVWIPIVEEGTKNQTEKFEKLGSKMPWYKVQFFSSTVIKYLKEECSYTGNAMSFVMDSEGQRKYPNALPLIRKHKDKFFHILLQLPLISIVANINNTTLDDWSKDDTKCIFLCGGMDESHFDDLKKKVMDASDTIKDFGVSIELFRLDSLEGNEAKAGEQPKYSADHESFWSGIKCLLDNYIHRVECKTVTKELCKLLSYKNHGEWVMVSQGYKLITSGRPATISMALGYMSQRKQQNLVLTKLAFGDIFLQEHKKAITVYLADKDQHDPDCCEFDISVGNLPKNMDCPVCDRSMERIFIISYKCCHGSH